MQHIVDRRVHRPTRLAVRRTLLVAALVVAGALPRPAGALEIKVETLKQRYEDELIRWALRETGLRPEARPEGKRIERIVIVRENIIAASDPWPRLLNIVHVKTREYIVEQELLVREGDLWDAGLVAESERNLRSMFVLATARAVACKASRPDRVVLLVVTKDIWSIRLNMLFSQNGQLVKVFDATPTESNFLGRNKRLSLHVRVSQFDFGGPALRDHLAVGARYVDPRLWGTRLGLAQAVDLIVDGDVPCGGQIGDQTGVWCNDRAAGSLAGVAVGMSLTRPLYSLATSWGFSLSGSVDIRQRRAFRQSQQGGLELSTLQFGPDLLVPEVYDGRRLEAAASFTRSFGQRLKHDVSWGLSAYSLRFSAPDSFPFGAVVDRLVEDFVYPRSETAVALSVSYGLRTTRFIRLRDVQGFALSEDYSIGPGISVGASFGQGLEQPSADELASGRGVGQAFVALSASIGYRWHLGGDLLHLSLAASTRLQPDLQLAGYDAPMVNNRLAVAIRNVSPVLWIGRLHAQAALSLIEDNLDRSRFYLGGDSGLRGYPSDQYQGRNLLRVNVEYRSLPLNLWTLHVGLVAFYDGGSAFGNPFPEGDGVPLVGHERPFAYRQSVGLGFRGHFPQFDRESLRIDLGFPLSSDRGSFGTWLSLSFGQTF